VATFAKPLILALVLCSGLAHAQSAADLETARALFGEARAARDGGDNKTALAKFRAAFTAAPTPIIAVELGKTYVQEGQLIEAREAFLSVSRIKVAADESQYSAQARSDAQTLAEELRPKIPSLVINVPEGKAAPTVSVDGTPIAAELLGQPRKVNPGQHSVEAVYPDGARTNKTVAIVEGATEQITLDAPAPAPPPVVVKAPIAPPPQTDVSKPLMFGGFGLAGAGLILGTITGIVTLGKKSDLDALCQGTRCPLSSQADVLAIQSSAQNWATVSTVSFIAAGVGASVGVVGLLLRPKGAEPSPGVALGIGLGSATLEGRF
jgi:hypothetical protein